MSLKSNISLINLSKQLPFEIDEALKKQLCFGETLIISCGHVEGHLTDSECSSTESSKSEELGQPENIKPCEIKEQLKESVSDECLEDEDNFQFYFFPNCAKHDEVRSSKSSLIIRNGMPQINPKKRQHHAHCTCEVDKHGQCKCFVRIPCRCGAKETSECVCSKLDEICLCNAGKPDLTCTCNEATVCMCNPDGKPQVVCTCNQINKPCFCHVGKFPYPICVCDYKHQMSSKDTYTDNYEVKGEHNEEKDSPSSQKSFCDCQKTEIKSFCVCKEKNKCKTCMPNPCQCDKLKTCICDPSKDTTVLDLEDDKQTCTCLNTEECSCDPILDVTCKCFPKNHKFLEASECTCGNPENCKCFHICQCTEPCICDTNKNENVFECTCYANSSDESVNQNIEERKKLKKLRAGKHGYRWCRDVDPRHTYFDYGYGRHEKINEKEEKQEKIKISDSKRDEVSSEVSAEEKMDMPIYKKMLGKLSLDCCSAVGGLTINVETLGEDKGKFLVQVVSHSSKEGAKTGSKLVSIVDCKLHTLEENRTEYIEKKDKFKEKRNYMAICESGYYNKATRICGDRHLIKRFYHTFEEARNFLLEGANIVLMRYVGLTRYKGCIKTDTVLIGGVICESIYVCLGVSHAVVNGRPFFVEKVERHIIEPSGNIHQTLLVLTLKGYVVSQEWANNSYIIHINPLLRVIPERNELEPHEPLRETWREDLQLLSDYLDFKAKRSSEGARYVAENGELSGTIRDYLQALLLLRPNDVLHFTRHYFGAALSALDLPHNEFFDSSTKHVRYYYFEE